MKLRQFSLTGIAQFDEFRASPLRDKARLLDLLEVPDLSEIVSDDIDLEVIQFANRMDLGEYLFTLFESAQISGLDNNQGIWSWLAAFYFEQLSPLSGNLGERARWVPSGDYRKYYRHLLAGPYKIYRAHRDNPDRALAILATSPAAPGDIVEQLASRQEIVTNKTLMEVATRLFIGPNQTPKRGVAGRGAGSARRFAQLLNQLDLTWDLYSLSPDKLLELLPAEFDRFRP